MIKSAARLLPTMIPAMIVSIMLLAAPSEAGATLRRWEQSGQASWYGSWHQGRPTSSGEPFDQGAMTAAHANLPLGSRVRVTRQDTGRSVVVTINDRQPPKGIRVIDLSRKAAVRLGMVDQGVSMVRLATVAPNEPIEVAEVPDDAPSASHALNPRQHGRPHMRRASP